MTFDPSYGQVPQTPPPPPQGQPYGVAPGQPYGVAPAPAAPAAPQPAPARVQETYGVAPPLDQVFSVRRPPSRSGILTALGVFALLASIAVPAAVAVVVNVTVTGCDTEGWSYPVCTDGTQGTLGVLYPLVAGLAAFVASTRVIANARHRPLRAIVWLAVAAIALVVLLAVVPDAAGVPFFGW
ncbi:hypothetical protein Bcav_1371 [Beutenbergia cavernae DSM 12333]|uniref:Uncharacterized protein n=1 Tax=Beutenbergia cavernae (strain ATCC BAA-8 / DSM 12333 / CCUG 43141 / JCM 11478 / NBRC 16432 / NCIMB 13614 / HKI 0122) TaxID=471853 RepID=C5C2E4_BEUC1|nr:hypothetical protein [Beutenbergia cavernae]ACQ79630.1 hypothetical protein Bcav_1371 [Beutenbergia cavernae DSM 12333]